MILKKLPPLFKSSIVMAFDFTHKSSLAAMNSWCKPHYISLTTIVNNRHDNILLILAEIARHQDLSLLKCHLNITDLSCTETRRNDDNKPVNYLQCVLPVKCNMWRACQRKEKSADDHSWQLHRKCRLVVAQELCACVYTAVYSRQVAPPQLFFLSSVPGWVLSAWVGPRCLGGNWTTSYCDVVCCTRGWRELRVCCAAGKTVKDRALVTQHRPTNKSCNPSQTGWMGERMGDHWGYWVGECWVSGWGSNCVVLLSWIRFTASIFLPWLAVQVPATLPTDIYARTLRNLTF